jgi:hypothetical protein
MKRTIQNEVSTEGAAEQAGAEKQNQVHGWWAVLLLLLHVFVLSGCATPALWRLTAAREWQPALPPDQFLLITSAGQQDLFVLFHQTVKFGETSKDRLVAWNLKEPGTSLIIDPLAALSLTNSCDRFTVLEAFNDETTAMEMGSGNPGYVVLDAGGTMFAVHVEGLPSGPFALPTSHEKGKMGLRIGLAPLAIATDAGLVAAAALGGAGCP